MTASIVYRRAALVAVGGFDERFTRAACEDFDLAFRVEDAGWRHRFVEGAAVGHPVHPPLGVAGWLARQRWRRAAVVRLYARHPHRFDPAWMGAAARWVRRPGAPITPATWARFFVLEAAFEAWAVRPGWWDAGRVVVAGLAAVGVAAGAVRDYVAGVFAGSRYIM
jgi:GT2 family glycosyltransferase